jgi:aldehyde:ferredoxin oxidoreductase
MISTPSTCSNVAMSSTSRSEADAFPRGGYAGRILLVDLSTGTIRIHQLDENWARTHIGGLGFGARIYLDLIKSGSSFDALSPQNPFIIMTGPLTGMRMHAAARWTVASKSPLTNYWGDANIGGYFGARLKFSGYDGIILTGAASVPVYLHIDDGRVELRDARRYWGQDIYTATDNLIADNRSESSQAGEVFTIGPAGEKLVRMATITNRKGHTAGRAGLGAVWGAKNLKAILVRGTGRIGAAHPDRLDALRRELDGIYRQSILIEALRSMGTPSQFDVGVILGDIPMKNWQLTAWDRFDEIGPSAYAERILMGNKTCYACGVACKREAEVRNGPFQFAKGPGPEYETVCTFGPLCLNSDIESIGKANELCNRYGLDTISCGATIAFAIECFENGLITEQDTDGLELTWGNSKAIVTMVERIGRLEGFGAVLAQGSARAAAVIGNGAGEFLTTVKGMEAPMHDPRSGHGYGLAYAVSPRGACHNASLQFYAESGSLYLPEFGAEIANLEEMDSRGKAAFNVISQDYGMFFGHCAGFCLLGAAVLNATQAVDMVNHVTGFDYTLDEVCHLGRRIWYLKRGLANLFGARAHEDRLPRRLMTPLEEGPTAGSVPDMGLMMREFYELRGLDANGLPRRQVLEDLHLEELSRLLHGSPE